MQIGACLLLGLLFASSSPQDVARAAQRVLARGEYQTEPPTDAEPLRPQKPPSGRGLAPLFRALFYVLIGIGVLLLVLGIATRWGGGRPTHRAAEPGRARAPPDEAELAGPREAAAALARAGGFTEAVHVLLLETLAILAARWEIPTSLTSREILGRLELGPPAHAALEALVRAVEVSLFGGREPGRAEYEACFEHFERLREALAQGEAA
ncbi:MAG: DUF4129 domain-containing protein [Planctomycetota bacterium]